MANCPKTPVFTHDTVHKAAVNEPQRVLSSSKIPHLAEKVASSQDNIGDSFLTPKPPFSIRNSSPSLQIVNPDSLGGSLSRRTYREGLDSPFTPWDGQLKALVRCVSMYSLFLKTIFGLMLSKICWPVFFALLLAIPK